MAKRTPRTRRAGWLACVQKCKAAFEPTNAAATTALSNLYGWQDFVVAWSHQTEIVAAYTPKGYVTNHSTPIFGLWEWVWDEGDALVETILEHVAQSSNLTTLDTYNNFERLKAAKLIYPDATISPSLATLIENNTRARERENSLQARLLLVNELRAAKAIRRLMPQEGDE